MKRSLLLPSLSALGFVIAIVAVVLSNTWQPSTPAMPMPRLHIPYRSYVAGAGVIESRMQNIPIGAPVGGIVTAIDVGWGDHVRAGDALFRIDDRALQAQLPPAQAKVQQAAAQLALVAHQLALAESVPDKRAISAEDMSNRRTHVAIARAALDTARANVTQIDKDLDLHTVRALAAGRVLQINIHLGEYAQAGAPLMLLGDDSRLLVRVDIDQNDAWRVRTGAAATAFLRGNPGIAIPLHFERIDPTVVPRAIVTGDSTERVDTRVLQVIYSFQPSKLPVYVGQIMDVYVQAPPDRRIHGSAPRP